MTEPLSNPGIPVTPSPRDPAVQAALDEDHLRLLKIAYYIAGGATVAFSSIFIFHFMMCLVMGLNPHAFPQSTANGQHIEPPPPGLFIGFAFVIGMVIILGWTFGALQIYAARCLGLRRNLLLIMVVAGVECIFIPWGTTIGVFTFLLLNRPSVKPLFNQR